MAIFTDEELVRIFAATSGVDQNYLDKYGDGGSGTGGGNIVVVQQPQPNAPGVIRSAGTPDIVYVEKERVDSFSCPVPGSGDCLSRIPREDIVQMNLVSSDTGKESTDINLDNVRGMNLCTISGLLRVDYGQAIPNPPPTVREQQAFYDELFFMVEWDLLFRGQEVSGFKDRPLSDLVGQPGCCDAPKVHVGCLIPEYGGMEFRVDFSKIVLPQWVDEVFVATRWNYSGCGCPGDGCGCGCGGSPMARNPYVINQSGTIPPIDP